MTPADLLQWVNLLLIPALWELVKIRESMAELRAHGAALEVRVKTAEEDLRVWRAEGHK